MFYLTIVQPFKILLHIFLIGYIFVIINITFYETKEDIINNQYNKIMHISSNNLTSNFISKVQAKLVTLTNSDIFNNTTIVKLFILFPSIYFSLIIILWNRKFDLNKKPIQITNTTNIKPRVTHAVD
jgi:hypothetical protein